MKAMQYEVESRESYLDSVINMVIRESNDLKAKIEAQSLTKAEKDALKLGVIKILTR
jgi:hypothetical protein